MNNQLPKNSIFESTIRLLMLLLIVVWCLLIMQPFANIILWSIILAMALYPMHKSLSSKMGNKPKLASFIIVFGILAIIILPASLLVNKLIHEVKELKVAFDAGNLVIPSPNEKVKEWPIIGTKLFDFWLAISSNFEHTVMQYKDQLAEIGSKIAKGILSAAGGIIQIIISLIIAGVLLVINGVGEAALKFFRKMAGNRGDELADVVMKTVGKVVQGVLGVALILAVLHAILFLLAGVPYAGVWTLLIFILAVLQLPIIFITIPIIIYIFTTHSLGMAIVWTVLLLIAGTSDNILKPILLGKGAPVPMLIIFIGVIGGFIFSGFLGMFTGAIVMSLGYKLFAEWLNTDSAAAEAAAE